jgi:hypothetical protein
MFLACRAFSVSWAIYRHSAAPVGTSIYMLSSTQILTVLSRPVWQPEVICTSQQAAVEQLLLNEGYQLDPDRERRWRFWTIPNAAHHISCNWALDVCNYVIAIEDFMSSVFLFSRAVICGFVVQKQQDVNCFSDSNRFAENYTKWGFMNLIWSDQLRKVVWWRTRYGHSKSALAV